MITLSKDYSVTVGILFDQCNGSVILVILNTLL
mgnify:CR=1 FL=1